MPYLTYQQWAEMLGDGAVRAVPGDLQDTPLVDNAILEAGHEVEQACRVAGYSVVSDGIPDSPTLRGIVFRVTTWLKLGHIFPDDGGKNAAIAEKDLTNLRKGNTDLGLVAAEAGPANPIGVGVPIGSEGEGRRLVMEHQLSPGVWPWRA